jgi:hypothetical protein
MKKEGYRKKTTFGKKKHRVSSGFAPVNRVLLGCCTSQSFILLGSIQPPGPGSTRRVSPGLITVI